MSADLEDRLKELGDANARLARLGRAMENERDELGRRLEAMELQRDDWQARATSLEAELKRAHEALKAAREGLSIGAGWASRKPDSQNARDKIKAGLDAIRSALRPALQPKEPTNAQ